MALIFRFFIFITIGIACNALEPEEFLKENPSIERKAIIDFITNQFEGKKVSQAQLDTLWNNKELRKSLSISRFQIVNQKLYADSYDTAHLHFILYLNYFEKLLKQHKISDIDFIIYTRDEIPEKKGFTEKILNIPAFMMSKDLNSIYERDMLLLPEPFMLKGWDVLLSKISEARQQYPWEQKQEEIFWRGGTSGGSRGAYNITNINKLPRLSLVIMSKLYPHIIDARFAYFTPSAFEGDDKSLLEIMKILFGIENTKVDETAHLKYKYLISIDGNTCAWVRVPWIMYSNSILVKQETSKIEWFYPAIKPYIHYVPVNERLTNIFDQYAWLKEHDSELQKISQTAHNFIQNELMPEHIDKHMVIILNEYAKIQQDKKITPTLTPAADTISMIDLLKSLIIQSTEKFIWWIKAWF